MNMKSLLLILMAMLSLCSCGAKQPEKQSAKPVAEKSIVIYFSHAGDNYSVGIIEEGNTKLVADMISSQTGADRLEIVCNKNYDLPYGELIEVAKKEQNEGELPAYTLMLNGEKVEGKADLSTYTTAYIGGPVWWGTYPQVMFTFFKDYDLNDKTILPFTTHEGSGLGSCANDLKKAYPKASFGKSFSIYGHEVRTEEGKKSVEKWLNI